MFGLFSRNKIQEWELKLLINVIKSLPPEYHYLLVPIHEGLFTRSSIDKNSGNVSFSYNSKIFKKYENERQPDFQINNIRIFDKISKQDLLYTIHVPDGVVGGYHISGAKDFDINVDRIDATAFIKKYDELTDFTMLANILNNDELELIDPNDVYQVPLKGKIYYHLRDLEDGDFIGIDEQKVIYKITRDPFEIIPINLSLEQLRSIW